MTGGQFLASDAVAQPVLNGNILLPFVHQVIGMDDGTFEVEVSVDCRRADTVRDEIGHIHLLRVLLARPIPQLTTDAGSRRPDLATACQLNLGDNISDQLLHQQREILRNPFGAPVRERNGRPDTVTLSNEVMPLLRGTFH
jgi:hypothetical protein